MPSSADGSGLQVLRLELQAPDHVAGLQTLLGEYALSPEGGGQALEPQALARLPEALAWLDRALGCHLSGFHAAVADALAEAPHPELRRRAARARALAAAPAATAAQDG